MRVKSVATREHQWVKHVLTPVEVLEGPAGTPYIFVDPDKQTAAENNAVYGCMACSEPMVSAFGTTCEGAEDAG